MTTRIYAVEGKDSFHLVEASTKIAALRHVAEKHFGVSVANQKTLVAAMRDGVQIEVAGAFDVVVIGDEQHGYVAEAA